MSSFNRRTLLLLPLAVAACGFTPVYGPGGAGQALHGKIQVQAPDDIQGYLMVQHLEERLGRATNPEFKLTLEAKTRSEGQAITPDNEITRFSIVGEADFQLSRLADEAVLAEGSVNNFVGYSATGSTVETLASERDARKRLMINLADQIAAELFATVDLDA